ncbi:MAG: potassium channel family protein [Bacteroidales bacterium]|nr:potassium channel family protein [Bacteroidales bacterium]
MNEKISNRLRHFFHVVSNIRPIVWIGLYLCVTPLFALIYWWLPDSQFRIPDGAGTDYGSWLYYSTVTITTLGFGDYTPAHGWAQAVTAIEVMCGLIFLGLFLNAVGSMKSEIDVASEVERRKRVYDAEQKERLLKNIPRLLHNINIFLAYCYAVTTPLAQRKETDTTYNPDFSFNDLADLFEPSQLSIDNSRLPAVERLLSSASNTSLLLDSVQNNVDLRQWPEVLEDCFSFVANYQMFSATDALTRRYRLDDTPGHISDRMRHDEESLSALVAGWHGDLNFKKEPLLQPVGELYSFIKENAGLALELETKLTSIALENKPS